MGILMPKATAVWLIDNTTLTFEQISEFCGLHMLEVNSIADGEVAETIRGADPVASGDLTREEIGAGEADPKYRLRSPKPRYEEPPPPKVRKARYTPISRRVNRPDAILWMLRNHAEVTDTQIIRLLGTTRNMIDQIRKRTHHNIDNIKPVDPVTLGLCSQIDLDAMVASGAERRRKMEETERENVEGPGLKPPEDSKRTEQDKAEDTVEAAPTISIESLFGGSDGPSDGG